jgi:hypothetical protein
MLKSVGSSLGSKKTQGHLIFFFWWAVASLQCQQQHAELARGNVIHGSVSVSLLTVLSR